MKLRGLSIGLFLIAAAYLAFLANVAASLLHPQRLAIQEYQEDWFKNPSAHGVDVAKFACDGGNIPCLFVSPNSQYKVSARGLALREQLKANGYTLNTHGKTQGYMVLLHGRMGRKENLLPVAERFATVGFRCIIPDLPAHGENPADTMRFSLRQDEAAIAEKVLQDARYFYRDFSSPAGVWGLSMGGAYAVHAVEKSPTLWKSLLVVSSFDSLAGVIRDQIRSFPITLPGITETVLIRIIQILGGVDINQVVPESWATQIKVPVLVVHGDADNLIDFSRGKSLFDGFTQAHYKQWLPVPGAGHNNILVTKEPVYAQMSAWLLKYVK